MSCRACSLVISTPAIETFPFAAGVESPPSWQAESVVKARAAVAAVAALRARRVFIVVDLSIVLPTDPCRRRYCRKLQIEHDGG
jgi:hypothetical protein